MGLAVELCRVRGVVAAHYREDLEEFKGEDSKPTRHHTDSPGHTLFVDFSSFNNKFA